MKSTYGANVCHLLNMNSRSIHTAESLKTDNNLPDPWSQFLNKNTPEQPVVGHNLLIDGFACVQLTRLMY